MENHFTFKCPITGAAERLSNCEGVHSKVMKGQAQDVERKVCALASLCWMCPVRNAFRVGGAWSKPETKPRWNTPRDQPANLPPKLSQYATSHTQPRLEDYRRAGFSDVDPKLRAHFKRVATGAKVEPPKEKRLTMNRFEKYQTNITSGSTPHRVDILLAGREVGEIIVEDGEVELRHPYDPKDPERAPIWRDDIIGWGDFDVTERNHFMHECVRRLDPIVDPEGEYGDLNPDEPVQQIAKASRPESYAAAVTEKVAQERQKAPQSAPKSKDASTRKKDVGARSVRSTDAPKNKPLSLKERSALAKLKKETSA